MAGAQVCDEFGCVLCGVDGEGFGNGEEGLGECGDGELLSGSLVVVSFVNSATDTNYMIEQTYH